MCVLRAVLRMSYLVETHLAAVGLWQGLAGDDLQQEHEFESVTKIILDVLDRGAGFTQMAVTPGGEGLCV